MLKPILAKSPITLLFVSSLCIAQYSERPDIRKEYIGTEETPDSLAFQDYVGFVHNQLTESRADAENFLVFTLQLSEDHRIKASALVSVFENAYWSIKQAVNSSETANLCPAYGPVRSNEEIFVAMDRQDDLNEAIIEQQYLHAVQLLDADTRVLLENELERHKKTFHYVTFNHKEAWETTQAGVNMQDITRGICDQLATEAEALNQERRQGQ